MNNRILWIYGIFLESGSHNWRTRECWCSVLTSRNHNVDEELNFETHSIWCNYSWNITENLDFSLIFISLYLLNRVVSEKMIGKENNSFDLKNLKLKYMFESKTHYVDFFKDFHSSLWITNIRKFSKNLEISFLKEVCGSYKMFNRLELSSNMFQMQKASIRAILSVEVNSKQHPGN